MIWGRNHKHSPLICIRESNRIQITKPSHVNPVKPSVANTSSAQSLGNRMMHVWHPIRTDLSSLFIFLVNNIFQTSSWFCFDDNSTSLFYFIQSFWSCHRPDFHPEHVHSQCCTCSLRMRHLREDTARPGGGTHAQSHFTLKDGNIMDECQPWIPVWPYCLKLVWIWVQNKKGPIMFILLYTNYLANIMKPWMKRFVCWAETVRGQKRHKPLDAGGARCSRRGNRFRRRDAIIRFEGRPLLLCCLATYRGFNSCSGPLRRREWDGCLRFAPQLITTNQALAFQGISHCKPQQFVPINSWLCAT